MVISADALHNRVLASRLIRDTSTYRTIDLPPLVTTSDRWFRPVDLEVGPDGAVYMTDWYDSRLTHVDPRDNWHKESGRIYRLQVKGSRPLPPFDLAKLIERRADRPARPPQQVAAAASGPPAGRAPRRHAAPAPPRTRRRRRESARAWRRSGP